ncbi:hypothetical protein [Nocardia albiluteola]|uniref:hypothetical protein n=1 Tax=Nocardia albiluteola TaxID=2842303 RepID=UPI001FD9745C|nr:hypothetical protein [Nocardia albiluteola]
MATEHPGMDAYRPSPEGTGDPSADEPTTRMPHPEQPQPNPTLPMPGMPHAESPGGTGEPASAAHPGQAGPGGSGGGSPDPTVAMPGMPYFGTPGGTAGFDPAPHPGPGFAQPNPTLAMPGVPNPLAGLGYPADPSAAAGPDVGGAIYHSSDEPGPSGEHEIGGAVYPSSPDHPRGSISRQEAGVTQPRPPTVAEARARDKARKRAEEAERAAAEALEAKRKRRRKALIGGAAVVGVAAIVGAGYLACQAAEQPDVTAYCVSDNTKGQQTVVNDNDCVAAQAYATNAGYYHSGLPAIFFFNGHQYHYYYGGTNTIGRPPTGGSFSEPSGAHISTKSGTVIRGGLGSKSGGKSGGS